jgi:TonB family protein
MAANSLLTPPDTSAADIVREMLTVAPAHELTAAARNLLTTEMLDRSVQSIEALDTASAQTWIDTAADLAADSARIVSAQTRLDDHLIALESRRLRPVTELTQIRHASPKYPELAERRGIEGWVELEFIVGADGGTTEIAVVDAENGDYFGDPAVATVKQWRFEPVSYLGRAIPQRAFVRVAFRLN